MTATDQALELVSDERYRHGVLLDRGTIPTDCASDGVHDVVKFAVLAEELGEVARAINEGHDAAELRGELVQVAAVATAWVEALL
jgi:hypothetical protein